jgi:hypothetical protein
MRGSLHGDLRRLRSSSLCNRHADRTIGAEARRLTDHHARTTCSKTHALLWQVTAPLSLERKPCHLADLGRTMRPRCQLLSVLFFEAPMSNERAGCYCVALATHDNRDRRLRATVHISSLKQSW